MSDQHDGKIGGRPLDGVRVLDFTQTLAGPFCTWLLSCLGADVVKVEPPGGDYLRAVKGGTIFATTNRNKRSVVIDLRTDKGRERAYRMVPEFDVLVESFKPGTMERFGLSYERVREANPSMVYASVSGFGQDGPQAERPGYDVIAQALSGIMAATGEPDRGPARVGTGAIDYSTGIYAALMVTAALARRQRTGEGSRIDACLLETALSLMSHAYTHYSVTGESQVRRGTANETFVPYQVFAVNGGEVFVGVATDTMFQNFCNSFGLENLAADQRLQTIQGRCDHREEIVEKTAEALRELSVDEVVERLVAIGVPTAKVLTVEEAMEHEQVRAREAIVWMDDPSFGKIAVTTFPGRIDGVPREAGRPAPSVGADTTDVFHALGLIEDEDRQ